MPLLFENDPNIDEISAEDLAGDYPAVEYTPPHGRYSLDILSRLGEACSYADLESETPDDFRGHPDLRRHPSHVV